MADYYCSPLWDVDDGGDLDLGELPLSGSLVERLNRWQQRYDDQLKLGKLEASEWFSEEAEAAFDEEGRSLAVEVQNELGEQFEVWYWLDRP